jgi:hypothetical protein
MTSRLAPAARGRHGRRPRVRPAPDELQTIPGVGPSIASDLRRIGIQRVADLRGRSPERLYARSNARAGVVQDRCLLYVFRCAVYFASTVRPRPERLKWWAWKDAREEPRMPRRQVAR